MEEIIMRNAKVLNLAPARIYCLYADEMAYINEELTIAAMDALNQNKGTEFVLADGLIIGVEP